MVPTSRRVAGVPALAAALVLVLATGACGAAAPTSPSAPASSGCGACPPHAQVLSFSDKLDKLVRGGVVLGGLSGMAFDRQSGSWVSTVDNHGADPARIWFWTDPRDPSVSRDPLVLRKPDGTAYDGTTTDDEGLIVLPDGDFLVSSETEGRRS